MKNSYTDGNNQHHIFIYTQRIQSYGGSPHKEKPFFKRIHVFFEVRQKEKK